MIENIHFNKYTNYTFVWSFLIQSYLSSTSREHALSNLEVAAFFVLMNGFFNPEIIVFGIPWYHFIKQSVF